MPDLFPLLHKHNTVRFTLPYLFHGILLVYCTAYSSAQKMGAVCPSGPVGSSRTQGVQPKMPYPS
jgi:hypothetical protein